MLKKKVLRLITALSFSSVLSVSFADSPYTWYTFNIPPFGSDSERGIGYVLARAYINAGFKNEVILTTPARWFHDMQDSNNNEIDVLVNDSDIDGETITLKAVSASGNGTVTMVNNKVNYSPASGFSGAETINYTIEDSEGLSASAELLVTVTATPVTPPTVEPESKSSGGGSVNYLLMILALALSRKIRKGSNNV